MSAEPHGRIYELADYESVIEAAGHPDIRAVLVGGQAVYFWAMRYRQRRSELDQYMPYTSQDADYLADESSARKLAEMLHCKFVRAPQKGGMLGLSLGHIPMNNGVDVEILGRVNGVMEAKIHRAALHLEWRGKTMHVIHPIQLYIAKGHNLIDLDQSDRQDGKHFAIMQLVLREFLAEIAANTENTAPTALLKSCESVMDFHLSDTGLKLIVQGHIPKIDPWPDLAAHASSKIQNFVRERLPRWKRELALQVERQRARHRSAKGSFIEEDHSAP